MSENYYRTGQAAKQLGVSSYQIRRLCECGLLDAELTTGKQWRIPDSELSRLKREGVPPIPQLVQEPPKSLPDPGPQPNGQPPEPKNPPAQEQEGLYGPPSEELVHSAEEVVIAENLLKRRKLDRDFEEVEDFFREREQKHQARLTAEQARTAELQVQNRRLHWQDQWIIHALRLVPWGAPKEIELHVHEAVAHALSRLDPAQPEHLVRRIVDAAAERGLAPWRQAERKRKALEAGLDRLPWDLKYSQDFADLKQRAFRLIDKALDALQPGATDVEMRESAEQAVQPVIHEYDHREACRRTIALISLPGATPEELEDALEVSKEALAALPIGASRRQLEKARDTALAPSRTKIREREEGRQAQIQRQLRSSTAELQAGLYLNHIKTHLQNEFEFDGGYLELIREANRLSEPVRQRLVKELAEHPNMTPTEIREYIEALVEELVEE